MKPSFEEINSLLRYEPETGLLYWKKIGRGRSLDLSKPAGSLNSDGYLAIRINYKSLYVHQIAWILSNGEWPRKDLDHKNRVRSDNRMINLREATRSENMRNGSHYKKNSSGFLGVQKRQYHGMRGEKWVARIMVDRKDIYLGMFPSINEAIETRKKAEKKYFGEFAPIIMEKVQT